MAEEIKNMPEQTKPQSTCRVYPHPKIALAMAYVPFQEFKELYNSEVGFDRGTVFKQLDQPFLGGGVNQ